MDVGVPQPRPPIGVSRPCWDSALAASTATLRPAALLHHLQTTGVGLAGRRPGAGGAVAGGLRRWASVRAVAVTVVDDAVVGWLAGLRSPVWLRRWGLAAPGSWTAMNVWLWGLLLALLVLHAPQPLVVLLAWLLQAAMIYILLALLVQRPRLFGVEFHRLDHLGAAV